MNYKEPFYLELRCGNNAFSWEKRGKKPRLFVPSVIDGTLEDVKIGEEVVFEDEDENGILQSCVGLKSFVRCEFMGTPAVVVDNHNHVFYFWYEALERRILEPGATLIHVDQHKDMREPPELFRGGDLDEVFRYTNEVLNVGNYIVPAIEGSLLGEVQLVTGEANLEDLSLVEVENKILNIDLDFFAKDLDYINFDLARSFIQEHARHAKFTTFATSPFFISQGRALEVLAKLGHS